MKPLLLPVFIVILFGCASGSNGDTNNVNNVNNTNNVGPPATSVPTPWT